MQLTKLALITFLTGLIALFFLSQSLEPKQVKISEINSKMMDNYVKIKGTITKIRQFDTLTSLSVNDNTDNITVICPKTNISKDSFVEVIGKVKEYNGILEIEAEKIQAEEN